MDPSTIQTVSAVVIAGVILLLSLTIFRRPIRLLLKLLLNTIGGFFFLLTLNFFGKFIGITLGLNWFNAIIVGIFGLPGLGLLLLLKWLLLI